MNKSDGVVGQSRSLWGEVSAHNDRIPRPTGETCSHQPGMARAAGTGTGTGRIVRSVIERLPRPMATMPDWTSSRTPNGSSTARKSLSLPALPVTSIVIASGATSTTLARKSWTASSTWPRVSASAFTLTSSSSRSMESWSSSSTILITSTSLFSCLVTCSSGESSTLTTMVIRETSGCSVGPTARESMLKPRRLNSPAMRASTPGLFSTRTESVCVLIVRTPWFRALRDAHFARSSGTNARCARSSTSGSQVVLLELGRQVAGVLDVVVGGACGDHRPHHRVALDPEVDDDRHVVYLHCLVDRGVHLGRVVAGEPDGAVRLCELHEVRHPPRVLNLRLQVGVGVAALVEQGLPLPHHAERLVVDDRDLDRDVLDRARRELLVGHLEATVAVDRPDAGLRTTDLGAHRGRNREAHRAEAPGVDPGVGVLEVHVVRGPHLVLPHTGDVDRLGAGDPTDSLDDVLRGEALCRGVVPEGVLHLHSGEELDPALVVTGGALLLLGLQRDDQVGDHLARITHDRDVGHAVLADLGGVDVGVDHLGTGGEGVEVSGDPVVEAGTQVDDQVALLQARDRGDGAVHARHAEVLGVAVGEGPARHQRRHDGDPGEFGERAQLFGGPRADHATTDVEDWTTGLQDQPAGLADLLGVRPGHRPVAGQVELGGPPEGRLRLKR